MTIQDVSTRPAAPTHGHRLRAVGAQGIRFAVVGSTMTVVQLALYAFLAGSVGDQAANLLSWFVVTVATTAAHRRFTFRLPGFGSERDHLVGLGTSVGGLLASALVLAILTASGSSDLVQTLGIAGASAVVGAGRFLVLRWWVNRGTAADPSATPPAAVAVTLAG